MTVDQVRFKLRPLYKRWDIQDWPSVYQNLVYKNHFAPGIDFFPPHQISKPMKSPGGLLITPASPRTGMPSGVTGKIIALNNADLINKGRTEFRHKASMGKMDTACIISAGFSTH